MSKFNRMLNPLGHFQQMLSSLRDAAGPAALAAQLTQQLVKSPVVDSHRFAITKILDLSLVKAASVGTASVVSPIMGAVHRTSGVHVDLIKTSQLAAIAASPSVAAHREPSRVIAALREQALSMSKISPAEHSALVASARFHRVEHLWTPSRASFARDAATLPTGPTGFRGLTAAALFKDFDHRSLDLPTPDVSAILNRTPTYTDIATVVDSVLEAIDTFRAGETRRQEDAESETPPDQSDVDVSEPPVLLSFATAALVKRRPLVSLEPMRVFLGAAAQDRAHRDALVKHLWALARNKVIVPWSDANLMPGDDRDAVTRQQFDLAALAIVLVTSDYLYELETHGMMDRLERRVKTGSAIPILLRPVDIRRTFLADVKALPSDGRFVTTWDNADDAWLNVASQLRDHIESCRARSRSFQ